jgi:plastocyanin
MERTTALLAGLAFAGIFVTACGSKTAPTPAVTTPPVTPPPPQTQIGVTVSIVSNSGIQAFSPNPATVPAGQTVTFRNSTGSNHRIVADNAGWDTGAIAGGASSTAISVTAPVSFHCAIHGSMVGSAVQ